MLWNYTGPGAPPFIFEATRTDVQGDPSISRIYICEAVGNPLPDFTWTALDLRINSRVSVMNGMGGVVIENIITQLEVTSTFILPLRNIIVGMPRCIATNVNGEDVRRSNDFVLLPPQGKQLWNTRCSSCSP